MSLNLVCGQIAHLEADHLIGLSGKEEILVAFVPGFDFLLNGGHEAVARECALLYLRVFDLEEQGALRLLRSKLLRHAVTAPTTPRLGTRV